MLLGGTLIYTASVMSWSIHLDFLVRILLLLCNILWLWSVLCSVTTDISGCCSWMWRWCSFILVLIERPVYPIHTLWLQGVLYILGDFRARLSLTRCSSQEIFLGGRPMILMSYLSNTADTVESLLDEGQVG